MIIIFGQKLHLEKKETEQYTKTESSIKMDEDVSYEFFDQQSAFK